LACFGFVRSAAEVYKPPSQSTSVILRKFCTEFWTLPKKKTSFRDEACSLGSGWLVDDFYAHGAGGSGDDFNGAFFVDGVELVFFDFSDFAELSAGDFADFFFVGFAAALLDVDFFADEIVDWAAEASPVEGSVFEDLDVDYDVFALEFFGFVVKRVDEVHHVQTPLTEGAAYWRTRGGFAARDAQF
jgi:hypothetical protein